MPKVNIQTDKVFVIYHGDNCPDGLASRLVAEKFFTTQRTDLDVVYQATDYTDPFPFSNEEIEKSTVIILDFSFKIEVLREVARHATLTIVLDHHKTAYEDLSELKSVKSRHRLRATFDMEKSGATLAWDFFFQNKETPIFLQHMEDRDLWRFHMKGTNEIVSVAMKEPYSFSRWDSLMSACELEDARDMMILDGIVLLKDRERRVEEYAKHAEPYMLLTKAGEIPCYVSFCESTLRSDVGNAILNNRPEDNKLFIGVCVYKDKHDNFKVSLRSSKSGIKVDSIAKELGGGGHERAASFTIGNFKDVLRKV